MSKRISDGASLILEHYLLVLMLLSLAALTLGGVGNATNVSQIGLVLCLAGFAQREAKVDLWVVGALAAYTLLGALASWRVQGHFAWGYTSPQSIFLVLYLLMACLDGGELRLFRRFSVLWAGCVAAHGLAYFLVRALAGRAGRLGGLLNNPNALGIFLAVAWFGLNAQAPGEAETGPIPAVMRRLEPLILTVLALTLSMGSFVSLAAGMLFLAAGWLRRDGWRKAALQTCRMLSKAGLAVALGVLMYFTARMTDIPWFALVLAGYLAALTALWPRLDRFLRDLPWVSCAMTAAGALVAVGTVLIRPSSIATFAERLDMMRNGLGYIAQHPITGVGAYQWRVLNLQDADTYFNTWHIHNVLIHVAVELGLPAAAALVAVIVRHYWKKAPNRAGFTAFLVHNLMDTSFFYLGITGLMEATAAEPQLGGKKLGSAAVKALFAALAVQFVYTLYIRVMT